MTRPLTSSKLLLVADTRQTDTESATVPVRRYRLARLRLEGRPAEASQRFEHLKRVFD
ncbi:MAG TPA: hypothetical protein VGI87_12620 [Solirubrobacteraceae bacterium]